jgi:hypothetical protein
VFIKKFDNAKINPVWPIKMLPKTTFTFFSSCGDLKDNMQVKDSHSGVLIYTIECKLL